MAYLVTRYALDRVTHWLDYHDGVCSAAGPWSRFRRRIEDDNRESKTEAAPALSFG
jgi:hypothetical protein